MDMMNWVQIQDKAIWISQSTNILEKYMYPTILSLGMSK